MAIISDRNDSLEWIIESLESGHPSLPLEVGDFTALDWAKLLEATPSRFRKQAWSMLPEQLQGATLAEMRADTCQQILKQLDSVQLMSLANHSSSDEIIDFIEYLPEKLVRGILRKLTPLQQEQVSTALEYDSSELGRYITYDALVVYDNVMVADILIDLQHVDDQYFHDKIYVVDQENRLTGSIAMPRLALARKKSPVSAIIDSDILAIEADAELPDAIQTLRGSQENHLPVVDEEHTLQGIFTQQQAISISQQNFEEQLSHQGMVSDEDLFAPVLKSSRSRAVWLGINLVTAIMASAVIGLFETTIAEVVALAVLMPIVASMGGITGSQTLTLAIRGLATGQLSSVNSWELSRKESSVSLLNGLLWALIIAGASWLWFESTLLALIIGIAILSNMLIASLAGVAIPMLLERYGVDPALAGSVILTTVTDVAGFFIFLGLASILLI